MAALSIALAQMNSTVGDLSGNATKILAACAKARDLGAALVVTPELSLVGYSPEDLLLCPHFQAAVTEALEQLCTALRAFPALWILVGHPKIQAGLCVNAVSVIHQGQIMHSYAKYALPNTGVFDEKRYFTAVDQTVVFPVNGIYCAINLCEDIWHTHPAQSARAAGAQILLIPNASPFHRGKFSERLVQLQKQARKHHLALIYVNAVGGQDHLVFDGNSLCMGADGQVMTILPHAKEAVELIHFDAAAQPCCHACLPFMTEEAAIYAALVLGIQDYVQKNGFHRVVLGLSGGVDSALVLVLAVDALGKQAVHSVMMPSPYTQEISREDAHTLAQNLGVLHREIPIHESFTAILTTLGLDSNHSSLVSENIQARIRGTLLMALANQEHALVLTTGNKSELALGYCTLYGDMAGGFAPLKDVTKTWVYRLCHYRNRQENIIPSRILTRAPSAELRPDQTDQQDLPPYAVIDPMLEQIMQDNASPKDLIAQGFLPADVARITQAIQHNEYKRRQAPIGPRVTSRSFDRDWRQPITNCLPKIL